MMLLSTPRVWLARGCHHTCPGERHYLASDRHPATRSLRGGIYRPAQHTANAGTRVLDGGHLRQAGGLLEPDLRRIIVPYLHAAVEANGQGFGCDLPQGETQVAAVHRLEGAVATEVGRYRILSFDDLETDDTSIL
jgi:hypothetical protein